MKIKFYHCSPKRLKIGTILRPSAPNASFGIRAVFMTKSPVPHFTIAEIILEDKNSWHCYEVEPLDKVFEGNWDDYITLNAKIVRYVGNAKGIMKNNMPKKVIRKNEYGEEYEAVIGSFVKRKDFKMLHKHNKLF